MAGVLAACLLQRLPLLANDLLWARFALYVRDPLHVRDPFISYLHICTLGRTPLVAYLVFGIYSSCPLWRGATSQAYGPGGIFLCLPVGAHFAKILWSLGWPSTDMSSKQD